MFELSQDVPVDLVQIFLELARGRVVGLELDFVTDGLDFGNLLTKDAVEQVLGRATLGAEHAQNAFLARASTAAWQYAWIFQQVNVARVVLEVDLARQGHDERIHPRFAIFRVSELWLEHFCCWFFFSWFVVVVVV